MLETFSVNGNSDVRTAFQRLRQAVIMLLRPGSRVVVVSREPQSLGNGQRRLRRRQSDQCFSTAYSQDEASAPVGTSRSLRCCPHHAAKLA
jgi:hypothetical protein